MKSRLNSWSSWFAVAIAGLFSSLPSVSASVIFYDSQSAFLANSLTTLQANFEGFDTENGDVETLAPYTEGEVTFDKVSGSAFLYIARPHGIAANTGFALPELVTSNVLTTSGNEDFLLTFAGPAPLFRRLNPPPADHESTGVDRIVR